MSQKTSISLPTLEADRSGRLKIEDQSGCWGQGGLAEVLWGGGGAVYSWKKKLEYLEMKAQLISSPMQTLTTEVGLSERPGVPEADTHELSWGAFALAQTLLFK